MCLGEAIDVLKKNKECMELVIELGHGTDKMVKFVIALDTVIEWVDKMYLALAKIGKFTN